MEAIENADLLEGNGQESQSLDALIYAIKSAPPPPKKMTKGDTLLALKKELLAAQKVGHTAASLATVLQSNGFKVSTRAVDTLLRVSKPKTQASLQANA